MKTLLVGALLTLVLAACSGGGTAASASAPPEADLTVSAENNEFDSPAITLTRAPSPWIAGIFSGPKSWYSGSLIFSLAGRLIQSWNPRISPSVCCGISEWITPLAAFIH